MYQSFIFVIPTKVVKEINDTLMAFLWSVFDLKHSVAKVRLEQVCSPKEKGRLGL